MAGIKRFGRREGIVSLVVPTCLYGMLACFLFLSIWPYFYYVKGEAIIVLGLFAAWRYSWLFINYIRAAIYSFHKYPQLCAIRDKLPEKSKYPDHVFFVIPSYGEEPWVSVEMVNSILSNLSTLPCTATMVVSTQGEADDKTIVAAFRAHPTHTKVELILQHQKDGKRVALGHALRVVARRYKDESNSVTILMDGDSYLERDSLAKCFPFFSAFKDLGALTTNELAYVHTRSQWYKDWFNLKFGQRNMLFQSHSLSNKVLTLTGRFSMFRTSIIVEESFIKMVESDSITHWLHGKFRFLMGDDKSSWYYLLKNKWSMLYLPDVKIYSLESRDADFWELSTSLPFRWHGNTLRNNGRALALGPEVTGWFIWFAILDQRLSMWTSLVGITGATILTIFKSFIYMPFYIAWVISIRLIQTAIIAFMGHPVSVLTIPLMLYNQWVGAFIKIKAFYFLGTQKWAKGSKIQNTDSRHSINSPMIKVLIKARYYLSFVIFLGAISAAHGVLRLPPSWYFIDTNQGVTTTLAIPDDIDHTHLIQKLIDNASENTIVELPPGTLNIKRPLTVNKSNLTIKGASSGTKLLASFKSDHRAVLEVHGSRGSGKLTGKRDNEDPFTIRVDDEFNLLSGAALSITVENDEAFFNRLESKSWRKRYPKLRRLITRVVAVKGDNIKLQHPLGEYFKGQLLEVTPLLEVSNVNIKDLTIEYTILGESIESVRNSYQNSYPEHKTDLIQLYWTTDVSIANVKLVNAGSHPIAIENSSRCNVRNVGVFDSWNKGKGGNGYFRLSKSHYCKIEKLVVKDIRHITFQWGASHNSIVDLYSNIDVNFHGGFANNNSVKGVFNIKNEHRWPAVYRTPNDAHWATPDGENNNVHALFNRE